VKGLVVVKEPGRVPELVLMELNRPDVTIPMWRELLGGAELLEHVRWGPGLYVATDEDAAGKHLEPNVMLARVSERGASLPPHFVVGPLVVWACDERGVTVGLSREDAESIRLILSMWAPGKLVGPRGAEALH
jgi:hypothetical protein